MKYYINMAILFYSINDSLEQMSSPAGFKVKGSIKEIRFSMGLLNSGQNSTWVRCSRNYGEGRKFWIYWLSIGSNSCREQTESLLSITGKRSKGVLDRSFHLGNLTNKIFLLLLWCREQTAFMISQVECPI